MNTVAVSRDQRPGGWSDGAAAYDEWFAPVSSRFAINAPRLPQITNRPRPHRKEPPCTYASPP
jgi:hypothetical protein